LEGKGKQKTGGITMSFPTIEYYESREEATKTATGELDFSRIPIVEVAISAYTPMVKSEVVGVLQFGNHRQRVVFQREKKCWIARSLRPWIKQKAREFNKLWFADVRINGQPFGEQEIAEGPTLWHIDSQDGLSKFVEALENSYGSLVRNITISPEEIVALGLAANIETKKEKK
jgi:hypothetical protein